MTLSEFNALQQETIKLTAAKLLKFWEIDGDAAWAKIDEMIPTVIANNPVLKGVSPSEIHDEIARQVLL